MRFERMSGLDEEQLSELECRVSELLEEPWDKEGGRPRELTFREALVVTCGYMRQNIIEDVWADIFDVAQSTISRYITFLRPLVEKATEEDRPVAEDAAEATRNAIALVDGTLWPCWSWAGESKLWSGKYKTTRHGSLIVTNLQSRITFVSEPVTGNQHDMVPSCSLGVKPSSDFTSSPIRLTPFTSMSVELAWTTCSSRSELEAWQARLDGLGIVNGGVVDASYGSALSFRDPDNIALEFFALPT